MSNEYWHIDNIPSRELPNKPGVYLLHDMIQSQNQLT
jgi:hypothetical protein